MLRGVGGPSIEAEVSVSSQSSGASSITQTESESHRGESSQGGGSLQVDICGHSLAIRSDRDPEFVEDLAAFLDAKVRELREAAPTAPFEKILMLASLTVAEELFETREELGELQGQLRERTSAMLEMIDSVESRLEAGPS
jgi:cell division protein ZapA